MVYNYYVFKVKNQILEGHSRCVDQAGNGFEVGTRPTDCLLLSGFEEQVMPAPWIAAGRPRAPKCDLIQFAGLQGTPENTTSVRYLLYSGAFWTSWQR